MTPKTFIFVGCKPLEQDEHDPITRKEFIAKWGFGDDKELNKQILADLDAVINTEINNKKDGKTR